MVVSRQLDPSASRRVVTQQACFFTDHHNIADTYCTAQERRKISKSTAVMFPQTESDLLQLLEVGLLQPHERAALTIFRWICPDMVD